MPLAPNELRLRQASLAPRSAVRWLTWGMILCLGMALLAACSAPLPTTPLPSTTPTLDRTQIFQSALLTATYNVPTATPTRTPLPPTATFTLTPTQTATPTRTPPALPEIFTSKLIDPAATPQAYIKDTCAYLKARLDPNKSEPGTVVMIVMYHSVTEDSKPITARDGSQVHHADVVAAFERAHQLGFQTITTAQLADFLQNNARIPRLSLLVIVDDRKTKTYYQSHFIPLLQKFQWSMTNAWISAPDTPDYLYKENEAVVSAGWVDVQAHGVVHNIPADGNSTDAFLQNEFNGSIKAIQEHFGKAPIGYIWPEGRFTQHAVELARAAGFQVGFTTNPRGPVMYNWVPQSDNATAHAGWLPEIPAGDPLMTLPRYWSSEAFAKMDQVVQIGQDAAAQAAKDRPTELDYYDIVCKPKTGDLPAANP